MSLRGQSRMQATYTVLIDHMRNTEEPNSLIMLQTMDP